MKRSVLGVLLLLGAACLTSAQNEWEAQFLRRLGIEEKTIEQLQEIQEEAARAIRGARLRLL